MPCRLDGADSGLTPTVFSRKFGYPGRLDPHEHVWLILAAAVGNARLTLNGSELGQAGAATFATDITANLKERNHLEIALDGQALGECYLEIRAAAYLESVSLVRLPGGKPHIAGSVAGSWDRPLELYVMVDGRQASYRTIAAGESFEADLEEAGQKVRVELVNVSTVWYVVEIMTTAR